MLPTHHSPTASAASAREQLSGRTLVVDDPLGRPPIPAFDVRSPSPSSQAQAHSQYAQQQQQHQQQQYQQPSWQSPTSSDERSPPSYAGGSHQHHPANQPQPSQHGRDGSTESTGSSDLGRTFVGSSTAALTDKAHAGPAGGQPSSRSELYDGGQDAHRPPQPSYLAALDPGSSDDDSDLGTATDTDDEFDWDGSDDGSPSSNANAGAGETAETIAKGGRSVSGSGSGAGAGAGKHRARRGRKVYMWLMGLSRWFRTLIVACVGAAVLITPFAVVITRFRDAPARTQVQTWSIFLCISFVFGCVTTVVVDFLPHLFTIIIFWINGKVPENLKTYVELLMALSLYTKLFACSAWTWITFSITRAAVKPTGSYWVYINRVLEAIFAALLVLLAEKLLLQVIAINFHRTSLRDRLDENGEALRALDKLSHAVGRFKKRPGLGGRTKSGQTTSAGPSRPGTPGPPPRRSTPPSSSSTTSTPKAVDYAAQHARGPSAHGPSPLSGGISDPTVLSAQQTSTSLPSAEDVPPAGVKRSRLGTMRDRRRAARARATAGKVVTGLGRQLKQVALLGVYGKGPEIGSLSSARQLARKLFDNLEKGGGGEKAGADERVLVVDDFLPYFRNEEDAAKAFKHFDSDGNGDISKREMRAAVQRIYKERKALTASLADMSSAISKLDGVLLGISLVICIFIFLLIFNKTSTVESLVPVSTFVLGFSFIFSNSAKTLFESLIFIFATHPFDVGDLVLIDADFLFVKEFGLVSTTFRRWDAQEIIAPNALLATTKLIHNIRRSRAMWEVCSIQVAYDTPLEVLEEINVRVKQYLADNSREWGGGHQVNINNITNMNVINLDIAIEHKSNWQDWGAKWARRTLFLKHLKTVLHELEVGYSLPVQPIVLPAGSENLQQFASNLFPGRDDAFGNAGGHGGTLSASPYPSTAPQTSSASGGGPRPSLSVQTAGFR